MKNTMLTFSFLLITAISFAQDKKMDLRIGYGVVTVPQIVEGLSTVLATGLVPGGYSSVDMSGSGALNGSLLFFPEKRFSMGIDMVMEKNKSTYSYSNGSKSTLKNSWWTFMARGDYKYTKEDNFVKLYASASAGASLLSSKGSGKKDKNTTFAFHVTPIGVRMGRSFAFYAEGGFGFKGLLNAGLSAQL
ncbi:hypothetical protein GVN16_08295 [Emticicia sp. CRIBPO]|uniref:hypothetical protein n=1 Tax=Emticicia sp. CRIBPO TaxID=2683258 RepID=UPI001412BD6F|nr:hypothetical protein [Emticicia sp. CRIBPO]NBA85755.1 hypothetical protein [Emticicia sp. CRIBPO]